MNDISANNKRIARNTIMLYIRMLFIMAVNLYISRVVLNTLGVVDYGIYNVVGGVVTMFAFLNGAMVTSTQRYITFELGRENIERLKAVFTTCFQIHVGISLVIILLSETVGLWILYEKMVIPEERFTAAMWVYQISILTMCVQVMSVPYNSDIIAHERMQVFATISVVEVILKLLVVYMLVIGNIDKLILYAVLIAVVQVFVRFLYTRYCKTHFEESVLKNSFDRKLVKEISSFMGWNIWGNFAASLYGMGLNLLLNTFFGPVVNAARGLAVQVEQAITQFSSNFQTAVNPQITKHYAAKQHEEMNSLVFSTSKLTAILLLFLSLPIFVETKLILSLWLNFVPEYTVIFVRFLLVIAIVNSMSGPLMVAASATGNVRLYQFSIGSVLLLVLPVSYLVLRLGGSPVSVMVVNLLCVILASAVRLFILKSLLRLNISNYLGEIVLRVLLVVAVSFPVPIVFSTLLSDGILRLSLVCLISWGVFLIVAYYLGLSRNERVFVRSLVLVGFKKLDIILHYGKHQGT